MTGRQVVAGVISNEQICIPIRLEICHNRKRSLPDGSVARLKRELQETVLAAYERRDTEYVNVYMLMDLAGYWLQITVIQQFIQ